MKKSVYLLTFIFCYFIMSITYASNYPTYLYGDKNLILCGAYQGVAYYVDKNSLVVEQNTPSHCKIVVNVLDTQFSSDGFHLDKLDSPIVKTRKFQFYYDLNNRKMYAWVEPSQYVKGNQWHYVAPVGSYAATGHFFPGEVAFYIAFNKKFYGGQKHYSNETHRYENVNFSDELYRYVDEAR